MKASTKATRTKMSPLSQRKTYLLDTYAAQCGKCYKWRSIDSQEEYEEIRYEAPRKSFECKTSCEEPGDVDVECDSAKVWFVDYLHGLPKTPQGLQRIVVVRESRNRCDVYYVTPQGKRLRNYKQVNDFIQDKKGFQYTNMEDITFSQPKLLKKTKLSHDKEIKSSSDALSIKEKDATLKKKSNTREETTERKKQVMDKNINKEAGTKHPPESEILSNEVIIEEIEKGKLDGKLAVKGKKISILYTGKLKDSGKVFDSTLGEGEAPLRFLIGGEKVIQGLSIGVEGMRVGDKRRIIIPPSLGYAEGLNEVVPENAWLVYEVEAVKCR